MGSIRESTEANGRTQEEEEAARSDGWTTSFNARPLSSSTPSGSATPRSWPSSPRNSVGSFPSRPSNSSLTQIGNSPSSMWISIFECLGLGLGSKQRGVKRKGPRKWYRKRIKGLVAVIALLGFFGVMNYLMLSRIQDSGHGLRYKYLKSNSSTLSIREELEKLGKVRKPPKTIYARLLAKAVHALAEGHNKPEPKDLWVEPYVLASTWKPCADQRSWQPSEGNNGYIMISANGGINQQRVAVCNAVAVARLLNATLVVPNFMYSSVWRDLSQFGDIYQEEYFVNYLQPDIRIVKELPKELQSLDLEAIGSVVTDADIMKEAKPSFYLKHILPILHRNGVVHFVGFGNRLSSDPIPFELQIQEAAALLLRRMRHNGTSPGPLDHYLVGLFSESGKGKGHSSKSSRYLALHLRFEIDMVAHSLCEFGGGEEERQQLQEYREIHFPALAQVEKTSKLPSPATLKAEGLCPLMPEETVLMLAALGFNRKTHIFLAGAHIYGGKSRLAILNSLYPNLVSKENLLSTSEMEPFRNFSSQLAALDFIVSTAADVFAMTDSGSQLSSLVSGYRVYYGGGKTPTIRPNKRRLADIFVKNNTIEWKVFEQRVRKAVRQTKRVRSRPVGRSVYRFPRCKQCMCNTE